MLRLDKARLSEKLTRQMRTAWTPPIHGLWVPRVHAVTWRNEVSALLQRNLGPTPEAVDNTSVLKSFSLLKKKVASWDGSRWDLSQTALSYSGALRRRYLEAERKLLVDGPVGKSDLFIRGFLKAEKWRPDKVSKPRMIFPRDPRYNLELASYLKPFEHWLWGNLRGFCSRGVSRTRDCAKGLGPRARAELIRRKMGQIKDCVVCEVDGKAFEAHVSRWQLEAEHSVYKAAYPGDRRLAWLLSGQLVNTGVTSCGVRFKREGGRASGDFNTGMGNSLVMLCVVRAVLRELTPCFDSLVDGDNALVFLPGDVAQNVLNRFHERALHVSGHEMVLERAVTVLEEVRFGQSAPVEITPGHYRMVRPWRKVLSQGTSTHVHLREPKFAREWLLGVATCEGFLASGVPVLWAWATGLQRSSGHKGPVRADPFREYEVLGVPLSILAGSTEISEPCATARESFCRAFGLSPDDQVALERVLLQGFSLGEPVVRPSTSFGAADAWFEDFPSAFQD